jgi:hypothetical protein
MWVTSTSYPTITKTIIASNSGADAVTCGGEAAPEFFCTDIYGNEGGDWVGCIADQANINNNFSADPLFCNTAAGDFRISSYSPCAPAHSPCGELVGALGLGCGPQHQPVHFDIKPGSCPNPLTAVGSPAGKAVLPVAVLGTVDFDVHDIDPQSLSLEGIALFRWSYEDVSTPVDRAEVSCACSDGGADGYEDLTLKFDRQAVVSALLLAIENQTSSSNENPHGVTNDWEKQMGRSGPLSRDSYVLRIEGKLKDGTPIEGYDCVTLRTKGDVGFVSGEASRDLELMGNHPNPFNPVTQISFYLPEAVHVHVDIYNILGQRVERLVDGVLESGEHMVEWDGSRAASGVYFYRFTAGEHIENRKMLLLK